MKRLAIIFPGVGYTKDRPLLYYAAKIMRANGFDAVNIDFSGLEWDKEALKDHARLMAILGECLNRTEKQLEGVDLEAAERVFFVSKSIGTVVSTAYARKKGIKAEQILFTPLEYISNFAEDGNGVVFYGSADPYADPAAIARICAEKHLETHVLESANHSLETGEVPLDIGNLRAVMERVEEIVSGRNIYSFKVEDMDGNLNSLSGYRGQVMLIINSATGCGFTPQYEALERLYRKHKAEGFVVLDFPCNQFGKQAPGTGEEIHSFCTARYDISFPQFQKIEVNGENALELFTYLKGKKGFHGFGDSPEAAYMRKKLGKEVPGYEDNSDIKWNFTKFLVGRNGEVLARFEPTEDMGLVEAAVEKALG